MKNNINNKYNSINKRWKMKDIKDIRVLNLFPILINAIDFYAISFWLIIFILLLFELSTILYINYLIILIIFLEDLLKYLINVDFIKAYYITYNLY